MNIRRFRRIVTFTSRRGKSAEIFKPIWLWFPVLGISIGLSSCSSTDQAFRSRVAGVGVQASGNVNTGDVGGEVVVALRDPNQGLSK